MLVLGLKLFDKKIVNIVIGRLRGVRVLPEFDAPAHVGNGWQFGESEGKGKLAVCVNQEPWQVDIILSIG